MLRRLRRTIGVLLAPTGTPDRIDEGISRFPDTAEVIAERESQSGAKYRRASNPAVTLIELTVVILLAVYVIGPILHGLLSPQTERGGTLLVSIVTGAMSYLYITAMESVHGQIASIVRLDFLDPYCGRRLKRTIQILKSRA